MDNSPTTTDRTDVRAVDLESEEIVAEGGTPRVDWRRVLPIAAAVLGLALAGTFFWLWLNDRDTEPGDVASFLAEQRTTVESRATEVIDLLMNYDAATLPDVSQDILEISTGNFREQYEEIIGPLGAALENASASSRGEIVAGPEVSFVTSSEAVALARVQQTTQSSELPSGRTIIYEMKITLINVEDGGWKADRIDILSQQES